MRRHAPLTHRILPGGVAQIALPGGRVCLVDAADLSRVLCYRWQAHWTGAKVYARAHVPGTGRGGRKVYMHRLLCEGVEVDHRNGDGLDNHRANLRSATRTLNSRNVRRHRDNQSGYKGVSFHAATGLWRARIWAFGRERMIGYYRDPREAALAYDAAAREVFKDFAETNFPEVPCADS